MTSAANAFHVATYSPRKAAWRRRAGALAVGLAGLTAPWANAAGWAPNGAYVQGGGGGNGFALASVGVVWDCQCLKGLWGGRIDGQLEAGLGVWNARGVDGRKNFAALTVIPVFRYRFDEGRSPWFVEGGIGAVVHDRLYTTKQKRFGTAINFSDQIGVGYRLSPKAELGLRLEHVSNGGVKEPNPGEDALQVRYTVRY